MTTMTEQTTQVYSVFIRATPEQVRDGITKPEFTTQYFYGSRAESTFEPGAPYLGLAGDGDQQLVEGEILESDPPAAAAVFVAVALGRGTVRRAHSRVTWEIEPQDGGVTKLTVIHDRARGLAEDGGERRRRLELHPQRPKTLLETGKPLSCPAVSRTRWRARVSARSARSSATRG